MAESYSFASLTPEIIEAATASLNAGALACLPNDTVYGIACVADNREAVERIYQIKHRGKEKPLATVYGDTADVLDLLSELDTAGRRAVARLLPGPVTLVLDAVSDDAIAVSETVGSPGCLAVRVVPPPLDEIYRQLPTPLALTSANLSGQPDPCTLDEVAPEVLDACEFAIDAGRCLVSIPSTVVDLRPLAHGQPAAILREGPVSAEEISRKLETLDREP